MKQRKINDEVLLQMLRARKTQKEIADFFGCSPVSVCKKLKKLLPPPKSLEVLTEKERNFVIEKAKGKTATQAAMDSYDVVSRESAKVIGCNLMDKPEIRQSIEDLLEHHGLTRSYRVQKLKDHVDHPDPNVSLKALDMSFKLDNSYPPKRSINANIDLNKEDLIDLSAYRDTGDREREDQD